MRAEGRVPTFLHGFPKYLRDAGYYCTNNAKTDYNAVFDMKAMWDEIERRGALAQPARRARRSSRCSISIRLTSRACSATRPGAVTSGRRIGPCRTATRRKSGVTSRATTT